MMRSLRQYVYFIQTANLKQVPAVTFSLTGARRMLRSKPRGQIRRLSRATWERLPLAEKYRVFSLEPRSVRVRP